MNEPTHRTVWGVTSYDMGGNAGFVVHALFTTKEQANLYAAVEPTEYAVEEFALYDQAPASYTYWHRGASVFPDGEVDDWVVEHTDQPPNTVPPVDDHLRPWNGHMQAHCGLHISIFGSDRDAVENAFQEQLADALARSNGTCSCGRTGRFQR